MINISYVNYLIVFDQINEFDWGNFDQKLQSINSITLYINWSINRSKPKRGPNKLFDQIIDVFKEKILQIRFMGFSFGDIYVLVEMKLKKSQYLVISINLSKFDQTEIFFINYFVKKLIKQNIQSIIWQ